jgi:hypothetical protein
MRSVIMTGLLIQVPAVLLLFVSGCDSAAIEPTASETNAAVPAVPTTNPDQSVAYPDGPAVTAVEGGDTTVVRAALSGTTTPVASGSWDSSPSATQDLSTDSGYWADQSIAASGTHVVITERESIGFFTRQGQQLVHTNADTLFASQLTSGGTFDTRVVWDQYRGRFFMTALTNTPSGSSRLVLGISTSSDPRTGWCMYNTGAGAGLTADVNADYDMIAVGPNAYVVTYTVNNHSLIRIFPAQQMANCVGGGSLTGLWNFISPDLLNGNGQTPGWIAPVMIHADPHGDNRIYAVATYGTSNATIWTVTNPLLSSRALSHRNITIPGEAFMHAFGNGPNIGAPQSGTTFKLGMYVTDGITFSLNPAIKAVLSTSNELAFAFNDAHDWGGGVTSSIHVVSLNPDTGAIVKNRKWGAGGLDYGFPGIEVNNAGDWAISFMRSGTSQFPEARYSAWGNGDADIRGSTSLQLASIAFSNPGACGAFCSLGSAYNGGETSSAALDPDGTSIWFSTMLPENPRAESFTQWVNKAYGNNLCSHEICQTGGTLTSGCQSCVTSICASDSFCCNTSWDSICVGEVNSICGINCP